jgi:hypothetical protein
MTVTPSLSGRVVGQRNFTRGAEDDRDLVAATLAVTGSVFASLLPYTSPAAYLAVFGIAAALALLGIAVATRTRAQLGADRT